MTLATGGLVYLALGFVLWVHAWVDGASTHTVCGCGDPALFLWFFQWPATALAHGENPFFSTALFHPSGINLLAQTSVMGLSVPLIPVTWVWGPVASVNVAATITPAICAFTAFVVLRRWVAWTPAAFLGGLLYGFSPFILNNLQFLHMMMAALVLLPLVLAVLDEILLRQRHRASTAGVLLGLLFFGQFFLSSELLVIMVMVVVPCVVVLVAAGLLLDREGLRRRASHAALGLAIGTAVGGVLLAWPVAFALWGPAHLNGLLWPNTSVIGGYIPSSFVDPGYVQGSKNVYLALGGYEGPQLGSSAYLGWGLLAVLAGGLVAFWRDKRLWFFSFVLAFCVACSFGWRRGQFEVSELFAHVPLLQNVIVQRFMAFGFLAAAVLLAMIVDKVRALAPDWRGGVGALTVAAVALVPIIVTFAPRLPYTMRTVALPRWYVQVAPKLPPNEVLLSFPAPFSGIQLAMTWQAVNRMHYSQAGGGGPQGVADRAGAAKAGFIVLSALDFGIGEHVPTGTAAELAAVRHALAVWRVTTVVIAPDPEVPPQQRGSDPTYAAAFMTIALGRLPQTQAGAWVWYGVTSTLGPAHSVGVGTLQQCVDRAEGSAGQVVVNERAPHCVLASTPKSG